MVVLVGDLVDDTVEHLKSIVEPLGELSCPRGMYFVSGISTSKILLNESMMVLVDRKTYGFQDEISLDFCNPSVFCPQVLSI